MTSIIMPVEGIRGEAKVMKVPDDFPRDVTPTVLRAWNDRFFNRLESAFTQA
ncbi:hypothetical protein [Paraburkholderia phytofirmans]|uniref:hypothetical protein n=1 Tax=Paraburkholderia TaxID=1822464 RepID=UPI001314D4D3|nr:hypothetical protein [Paraburkholderia phytofirmans]